MKQKEPRVQDRTSSASSRPGRARGTSRRPPAGSPPWLSWSWPNATVAGEKARPARPAGSSSA
ncbi:MAG: hypothetical protein M0C28_03315 [Candidatus Moduliflexus flocculans]|nr:hypothetical protein [Candidatus Moduliflexus flocculans]